MNLSLLLLTIFLTCSITPLVKTMNQSKEQRSLRKMRKDISKMPNTGLKPISKKSDLELGPATSEEIRSMLAQAMTTKKNHVTSSLKAFSCVNKQAEASLSKLKKEHIKYGTASIACSLFSGWVTFDHISSLGIGLIGLNSIYQTWCIHDQQEKLSTLASLENDPEQLIAYATTMQDQFSKGQRKRLHGITSAHKDLKRLSTFSSQFDKIKNERINSSK